MFNLAAVAHCEKTGNIGALAFGNRRAIGARLIRVYPRLGVAASLGVPNPMHLDWAFKALQKKITPEEALITTLAKDGERDWRQVMLIDREGLAAARTGKKAPFRSAHFVEPHFAAGGTGLQSEETLAALVRGFQQTRSSDLPLENRLIGALEEAALSGTLPRSAPQSAALVVYGDESWPLIDLRADDGDRPIRDLRRLLDRFHEETRKGLMALPSRHMFGASHDAAL